jgi:hypothetical protein
LFVQLLPSIQTISVGFLGQGRVTGLRGDDFWLTSGVDD